MGSTKERPILFSGAMVRALLEGQKTQTRRVIKPQPVTVRRWANAETDGLRWTWPNGDEATYADRPDVLKGYLERDFWPHSPYGQPGECLWVRETWRAWPLVGAGDLWRFEFQADESTRDLLVPAEWAPPKTLARQHVPWVPSIFLPRFASRLTLEVTEVRVQRLQEISEEDARAEGVWAAPFCKAGRPDGLEHVESFELLWQTINGKRPGCSWESNPWVWCVSFRRLT